MAQSPENALRDFAVITGISRYSDRTVKNLHGAANDAASFAAALQTWGFHRERIRLLIDEDATKDTILKTLRQWPLLESEGEFPQRVLFFFAGHGMRLRDPAMVDQSYILPYDFSSRDRDYTGISLRELFNAVWKCRPLETYLFLDACALEIHHFSPPRTWTDERTIPEADLVDQIAQRFVFALFAAGPGESIEADRRGLFTQTLLKGISAIRTSHPSCTLLANTVRDGLVRLGLGRPTCLVFGATDGWFLRNQLHQTVSPINTAASDQVEVYRTSDVATLRDILITHRAVWIWGEGGLGKTTLVKQFAGSGDSLYISIDTGLSSHSCTSAGEEDIICSLLVAQMERTGGSVSSTGDPRVVLDEIVRTGSHSVVIIDHLDRLTVDGRRRVQGLAMAYSALQFGSVQ